MKVLLCDQDPLWAGELAVHMQFSGMDVKIARELEELWSDSGEVQGVLVSRQEMESMLFWGETAMGKADAAAVSYLSAIRSLCLQGKKVILILPEQDYVAECACLRSGAVECLHKQQPLELMLQRIRLAFREEMHREVLWFGDVQLDLLAGKLLWREEEILLTVMETRMMELLFAHKNTLTKKEVILSGIWGEETDAARRRLDTLLKHIRRKLRGFPIGIYTCYGKGYYLESGLIGGN